MTEYPNWFNYTAKANFERFLLPLAGVDGLRFLQLGVFTGDASKWLLDNVLTGHSCRLDDVDTWQGSKEAVHEIMDWKDVLDTYLEKTKPYENLRRWRCSTLDFLTDPSAVKEYDFIYIDADHTAAGVLLDAEMSWPLLKRDGIMAFDDLEWTSDDLDPRLEPKMGIDLFLLRHKGEYEVLVMNSQAWIKKI